MIGYRTQINGKYTPWFLSEERLRAEISAYCPTVHLLDTDIERGEVNAYEIEWTVAGSKESGPTRIGIPEKGFGEPQRFARELIHWKFGENIRSKVRAIRMLSTQTALRWT